MQRAERGDRMKPAEKDLYFPERYSIIEVICAVKHEGGCMAVFFATGASDSVDQSIGGNRV